MKRLSVLVVILAAAVLLYASAAHAGDVEDGIAGASLTLSRWYTGRVGPVALIGSSNGRTLAGYAIGGFGGAVKSADGKSIDGGVGGVTWERSYRSGRVRWSFGGMLGVGGERAVLDGSTERTAFVLGGPRMGVTWPAARSGISLQLNAGYLVSAAVWSGAGGPWSGRSTGWSGPFVELGVVIGAIHN